MTQAALTLLRQLAAATGTDTGRLSEFLRRVARAGELDTADEAILDALTREIDVRKRLRANYAPDFQQAQDELPAPPAVTEALAGLLHFSAVRAAVRDDRALGLKRLNTALKAADLAGTGNSDLRAALQASIERLCIEAAL